MHLYLSNNPRTLYLITDEKDELLGRPRRALRFRIGRDRSQAVVALLPTREVDRNGLVKLTNRTVKGCLGLISVDNDIFLAVVTSATEIGNTRPSAHEHESVAKIHEVCFYSLTSTTWDDSLLSEPAFGPEAVDTAFRETYASNTPIFEHPCMPLTKILSSGTFYYATEPTWDLSSRLSVRLARDAASSRDIGTFDERFIWNEYILRSLLDFRERLDFHEREEMDRCQFLILTIQGYVGVFEMPLRAPPTDGAPTIATLALISRLGWKRAGTRFNTRGVDDDGNCANFVETETVFSTDQHCVSYVQVRGSVPLFWEQQGLQTFGQRIQITRPHASQPAFERHLSQLMEEYGSVHAINLLGTKENEALLTNSYARHLYQARSALGENLGLTNFDFHNAVRIGGHESIIRNLPRMESISDNVDKFGFTMCDASTDGIITDQKGIFRTNCLDCLDRTNFVQDIMSKTTLEQYLDLVRREWLASMQLWSNHRELWAENGDALSRIYAGTGALNTSFTRSGKRTLAGVLSDATKSVSRAYINNFQDKGKQVAIDMFLGNLSDQKQVTIFDPIHDTVREALNRRWAEYSTTKKASIMVGTWNLNGRMTVESLIPWLFPRDGAPEPDMIVLGFQEIVPLTAQQIVQTDPEKRRLWEKKVMDSIERKPGRKSRYVLLRSEQLVGTALFVIVKDELTSVIRNVEGTSRKTGLRGMSGNKGAVGIRLDYHDTNLCFLTAHLAAGHSNIDERNEITEPSWTAFISKRAKQLRVMSGNVVWLADTNYRIDLDNATVRAYAEADDFDPLVAADQLRDAMDTGAAFTGYEEGPLLFRPTYRYDVGTDNYDTSEKMRIPAWTEDRILYRGTALDLSVYSRAEMRGSDHKPVFGIFRADIRVVDTVKKAALSQLLLENIVSTQPNENLDEKLAGVALPDSVGELPPPSTDEKAWWDTPDGPGGLVSIDEIQTFNLYRTGNPFESPLDSPISVSPTTSDEELFTSALALQTPLTPVPVGARRPPPPPPPRSGKE
ncbi:Inositol-1,4,5-trisphosphate 5-phosphatase 1 [Leucoagaricus sp. SymC.cos]|nr:Inositol-1,4,5-trisphosphate 5-phosphatase 1 [Leucoagaricus sp. SymC.cos]